MFGSTRHEYRSIALPGTQLFSVSLSGRTLWVWERRSGSGRLLARSARFFPDYLACLFDAQRGPS